MSHTSQTYWVLGHRVTPVQTDADYALLHIETPPGADGPPPHYHEDAAEVFLIIRGRLEVMKNGQWSTLSAGQSTVVPVGVLHTFRNLDNQPCEWVTSFSPRRFGDFFVDMGVPVERDGSREASLAPELIGRVISECAGYGMIIPEEVLRAAAPARATEPAMA